MNVQKHLFVLLCLSTLLTSCTGAREVYLNEDLTLLKPQRILFTQALGIKALNAIVVDGGSYFDQQMEAALIQQGIKSEPVTVDFDLQDSVRIAEVCNVKGVDGMLFTHVQRTYRDTDPTYHTNYALGAGSVIYLTYFNSSGRAVVSLRLPPSDHENVKKALKRSVSRGVKAFGKVYDE